MKKKIIFVHFNRFLNDFDWQRYELDMLSKKFQIEVHVLINLVHPHLRNKKYSQNYKNKKVKIFDSLNNWKNNLNNLNKNCHFIFQTFPYNFSALQIYYTIKKKGFKNSIIYINNLPSYSNYDYSRNFLIDFFKKFLSLIYRPKHSIAFLKKKVISIIFMLFPKMLSPNFSLIGGKLTKSKKFSKNININSWDYSNTLRKNRKGKIVDKSFILYVSDGETRYQSDSQLWNTKRVENTELYLRNLNNFFNQIEKKLKLKILIAAHPRSNPKLKVDRELGKRKSYYGKTFELTKKAKFIISWGSTALSYAIMLKKPILFIHSSSQQKKNVSGSKFSEFFSKILNCNRMDIDNSFKNFDINQSISTSSYNDFTENYIISKKSIPNYKIIEKNLGL